MCIRDSVNDGSNDGTELKAQKYVRKYPDSYQIINKVNGGHGSTINIGSKVARGKYFKIIDADDCCLLYTSRCV